MKTVRLGLAGCGLFGESHLQAFRAVRSAEVVAAYDVDRGRAEAMAQQFGIRRVCASLQEICHLPEVDAIDVVTPEHLHLEPVLEALAAGKHVFVEKPLATDLSQCAQMIEAARVHDRALMVGQILRFETKYAMLKDEVAAGRLGNIVSMHARRNRLKSLLPVYGRTHPALENSIHDIDLMLWYNDKAVQRVRGYGRRATNGKNPDTFWGVLEFEGGAIGVVETIWLLPPAAGIMLDDAFQLIGTAGLANIQLLPGSFTLLRETGYEVPDVTYDPRVAQSARGALRDELAYFCECVLENRKPSVITAEAAKRAVRVVLALIESEKSGKDVELSEWD
ncbi:MAG TPA: Gfo/Idh/MocA family oxidoreductase [Bryobacteraceae bacterium]|nr:Gfo/Idh/MocA family oxidoreductase [Bryobacteraceae bacterium]